MIPSSLESSLLMTLTLLFFSFSLLSSTLLSSSLSQHHLEQSRRDYDERPGDAERTIERALSVLANYCEQCKVESNCKVRSHGKPPPKFLSVFP